MNEYYVIKARAQVDTVEADTFSVGHAGELYFRSHATISVCYAPGTWSKVEKK